ncbi:MAG TPA: hypothetical protein GX396_01700 [Tissierellia bacterium]|jgi:hypothetical protein|nr:hypothetical protein [Tissierellia bacterium]
MDIKEFHSETLNKIYSKINEGYKRVSLMSIPGTGMTMLSSRLAREMVEKGKVLVVFDTLALQYNFAEMIKRQGINPNDDRICLLTYSKFLSQSDSQINLASFSYIFLFDLRTYARKKIMPLLKDLDATIVSFGIFGQEIESDNTTYIEMGINHTFMKQRYCVVFGLNKVLDVRDVSAAPVEEKDSILEQAELKMRTIQQLEEDIVKKIEKIITEKIEKEKALLEAENEKLRKKLAEMESYKGFLEQVCVAAGIPIDKLQETYKIIKELKNIYGKKLSASLTEKDKEIIYKKLQDRIVNEICNLTRDYCNTLSKENYEVDLFEYLGTDVWDKLSDESKVFLTTAKLTYDSMERMKGSDELDYSGVCLLVTKAMEMEMFTRVYSGYIKYLNEKYGKDYVSWPECTLSVLKNKEIEPDNFTLGSVMYFIGLYPNGKPVRVNKIERPEFFIEFDMYARDILYNNKISQVQRKNKLLNCVESIEKVRLDYRNPSAHRGRLPVTKAIDCWEYVIEIQKRLKVILQDFNF